MLNSIERIIFSIKAHDWIETSKESLEILKNMHIEPKKITQDQFENEWKKAEAGY